MILQYSIYFHHGNDLCTEIKMSIFIGIFVCILTRVEAKTLLVALVIYIFYVFWYHLHLRKHSYEKKVCAV